MTSPSVMQQSRSVGACDSFSSLVELGLRESVELALWQRRMSPEVRDAFQSLDFTGVRDFRVDGDAALILSAAEVFLENRCWAKNVADCILSDVRGILGAGAGRSAEYTLRLENVTDDACRKFHKDKTDIRLITTYCGRGTQWIEVCAGTTEPVIQEMATFEVGMFLGKRCGKTGRIFHRSPPIEGTGNARFMMVLDVERPGRDC
nr:DUF1826 domain-containing protein [uncultured Hyphomonas sp.]